MRLPTWSCHGSRVTPIFSRNVSRTAGHPVDTAPFGAATFRAISESRGVERFILDDVRGIRTFLPRPQINRLNLLSDVLQTTRQRRQITRRTLRIRNSRSNPSTHRDQQRPMITRRRSLRHRLLLRLHRLLIRPNSTQSTTFRRQSDHPRPARSMYKYAPGNTSGRKLVWKKRHKYSGT